MSRTHAYVVAAAAGFGTGLLLHLLLLLGAAPLVPSSGKVTAVWISVIPLHLIGTLVAVKVLADRLYPESVVRLLLLLRPSCGYGKMAKECLVWLLLLVPASAALTWLMRIILINLGTEPQGSPLIELLLTADNAALWAAIVPVAVLVVPLTEEILFRSILYEALAGVTGTKAASGATAALFAVLHFTPVHLPALFVLSLVLQRLRNRLGTLWAAVTLHATINGCSLAAVALIKQLDAPWP